MSAEFEAFTAEQARIAQTAVELRREIAAQRLLVERCAKVVLVCDRRRGTVHLHGGTEIEAYRLLTCRPDLTVEQLREAVEAGEVAFEVFDLARPVLHRVDIAFSRL